MRKQFVDMLKAKRIKEFEGRTKGFHDQESLPKLKKDKNVPENVIGRFSFQVICDCKLPPSFGNVIICDNCSKEFHLECYYLTEEIASVIDFNCYSCRCTTKTEQPTKNESSLIETAASKILSLPIDNLRNYISGTLNIKKDQLTSLSMYQKMEELFETFDLVDVLLSRGKIHEAVLKYFKKYQRDLPLYIPELSNRELLHLSLMLICDITNTHLPPLWYQGSKDVIDLEADGALEGILSKCERKLTDLRVRELDLLTMTEHVCTGTKDYKKYVNELSYILNGIDKAEGACQTMKKDIMKALAKSGTEEKQNVVQKKAMVLQTLSNIYDNMQKCRDDLSLHMKRD